MACLYCNSYKGDASVSSAFTFTAASNISFFTFIQVCVCVFVWSSSWDTFALINTTEHLTFKQSVTSSKCGRMLPSPPSLPDHLSSLPFDLQAEEQRTGMRMDYGKDQSCSHSYCRFCSELLEQDRLFTPVFSYVSVFGFQVDWWYLL